MRSAALLVPAALLAGALQSGCVDLSLEPNHAPASLVVVPADTMLAVGDEVTFSVVVLDEDGAPITPLPSWARPVWRSDDPETLQLSLDGSARAVDYAETEVSVVYAGLRARTPVRVNPTRLTLTAPTWYITQGVQNQTRGVPLIEGRDALLRVFVTGDRLSYYQPRVEALFYQSDALVHGVAMSPPFRRMPTEVDESRLDQSFNALIPGSVIQPGVTLAIRLDVDGVVPTWPESRLRIPDHGALPLDVRPVPPLELVVVPISTESDPKGEVRQWASDIDPASPKLHLLRSLLPVAETTVRVHEGFFSTANLATGAGWGELLGELVFLRIREGERGHYYGAVKLGPDAVWDGLGQIGYPASVGKPDPVTLTHELGHNLGLRHAPCGGAIAADVAYPYNGGEIGVWGYDFFAERLVNASLYKDVMSYCSPRWMSDYHFARALYFREHGEAPPSAAAADPNPGLMVPQVAAAQSADRTLLLWGSVGLGELTLDPALLVDAPVSLPTRPGPYRLQGLGVNGQPRFSLNFSPTPLEYGGANFVFTVPYDAERDGSLDRVVLSGPEGSYTLERFGSPPVAMVVDRSSGKLKAVLRNWDGAWPRALPGSERDSHIAVSEGLPF